MSVRVGQTIKSELSNVQTQVPFIGCGEVNETKATLVRETGDIISEYHSLPSQYPLSGRLSRQAMMPQHISWFVILTRIAFGQSGPETSILGTQGLIALPSSLSIELIVL